MKLNADIIFSRLAEKIPVEMFGNRSRKLLLSRPELYIDNELDFYRDHLYLASVEHLPQRPRIEGNVVLVCIGDGSRLNYYKERATVLLIRYKHDFFTVFRMLQEIFDTFERWEHRLFDIFLGDMDVRDVIKCSYEALGKPLYLLDSGFQLIAMAGPRAEHFWPASGNSLSQDTISTFLRQAEPNLDKRGAMLMNFPEGSWLCVNVFDNNGEYAGCVVLDCGPDGSAHGDEALCEFLGGMVEKLYEKNPSFLRNDRSALREALQRLLQELPLGSAQRIVLSAANCNERYVCVCLRQTSQLTPLPESYICSAIETSFPGSITLKHNNAILALCNLSRLSEVGGEDRAALEGRMNTLLGDMRLKAGVSKAFVDLEELKQRVFQAEAALENGLLLRPEQSAYFFEEFALTEMLMNSLGGQPVEAFFPDGLQELIEHDKDSDISYLETLSVFFDENMSYAKTAARLYVHRSTLIDRIARIEKELGLDLRDTSVRLRLQLVLMALDMEETMKKR